jgi:hypothetical protein
LSRRIALTFVTAAALFAVAAPRSALADCVSPAGIEGEIVYSTDFKVMQFCDGTDWIGMTGGSGGGGAGVTDGDKGDITVSGSGASWLIDDDLLDFTEFKDALSLDASTDIAISGSQVFSLTNTGTANSFVVNDQASDTSPFVIDAAGNVGIGLTTPTQVLDVVGKITSDGYIAKAVASIPAPMGGSTAQWTTDGTHVWRATGNVGIGVSTLVSGVKLEIAAANLADATGGNVLIRTTDSQAINKGGYLGFGGLYSGTSVAQWAGIRGGKENGTDGDYAGYLSFLTRANGGSTAERMRITASGNVGIGTVAPIARLDVWNTGNAGYMTALVDVLTKSALKVRPHNSDSVALYVGSTNTGAITLQNSQGSGAAGYPIALNPFGSDVGIGTTSPSYKLHVVGQVAGNAAYVNTSDERLKKDVADLDYGLATVEKLRPVSFQWKEQTQNYQKGRKLGLIAQETEAVVPEVVTTASDGMGTKSIAYGDLTPILISAIQELKADNDNLRAQHDADLKVLRAEIEALKAAR